MKRIRDLSKYLGLEKVVRIIPILNNIVKKIDDPDNNNDNDFKFLGVEYVDIIDMLRKDYVKKIVSQPFFSLMVENADDGEHQNGTMLLHGDMLLNGDGTVIKDVRKLSDADSKVFYVVMFKDVPVQLKVWNDLFHSHTVIIKFGLVSFDIEVKHNNVEQTAKFELCYPTKEDEAAAKFYGLSV